jgi:FKBP-type peptidyl-prolyl cis-trans isomerase
LTCALALALALLFAPAAALPQSVQTTTVQGTVYTAGGAPTAGTLQITWPAFTTAGGQAIAAGRTIVNIPANGQVSVALAPNIGATPAGLYYTAIYHLSDGGTSTEYWVVPNTLQATLASVRATVMPAAQAVQAVSKAYVDQSIQQAVSSQITPSGGTLTGPLYLAGDPNSPAQAANKHYVDSSVAGALPIGGGVLSGPVTATQIGAVYQADQFPGNDFGGQLQACLNALNPSYGGTCDARNFAGSLSMGANLTVSSPNVTIYLPCSTIATAASIFVLAGTRNVTFHGCASRGTSAASGTQGGTVLLYSGNSALLQVGDPGYVADTKGFHLDNAALNTTPSASSSAEAILFFRTQEISLSELYLLGNSNQTALTLDGTGNYTGGTFEDLQITGYQTAVNGIGHTVDNPATTDWLNASTFVRLHVDCPTQNGNPISGATGINLLAGDGNTFTGGDIESCSTALHLGPHAQNNTIVGLRNENSSNQVIADSGSSYNNWITGGTMFTGKLTDNGTRNSFLDTFHRSFNGLNGDWYGSQQDLTVTNHFRLGIGSGNERGLLNRYQTDSGYRWTTGISDATSGEQYYQVLDELNNVYRLSIGQYNSGQPSTNNQTGINAAGTGAVILNGSNNAGTGGVVFGSGGPASTTVATVDKAGNAHFTGTLLTDSTAQSTGTLTVRNNADSEVDYYLWPGLTTSQKGSFTYKDFNGASQWYMVKDASNNWALNSAIGGLDSIKAYQSSNSGDTYINAANPGGAVRINYETGAGAAFNIYGGSSSNLYAGFTAPNAIKFPGLAAASGKNCLQIDNSGYISNTTSPCSSGVGTVSTGTDGQIAYYTANGTAIGGTSTVPLGAGGTGSTTASGALANLGAVPLAGGTMTGALTATQFNGPVHGDVTGNVNGNVTGNVTGNLSGNVTFADNTIQTTSQQGALTGSANDATARSGAAAAQTSANTAETDAQAGISAAAGAQTSANSALNGQANDSTARSAAAQAETDAQAAQTSAATANTAATAARALATTALPANGITSTGSGIANLVAFPGTIAAAQASVGGGPRIDVTYYGAKCDGVHPDNNAIQAALNAWVAGGYTLAFPTGQTCIVTTPLAATFTRTPAQPLIIDMRGATLRSQVTSGTFLHIVNGAANVYTSNIILRDGTIADDGFGASIIVDLDGSSNLNAGMSRVFLDNMTLTTTSYTTTAFQTENTFQGACFNSRVYGPNSTSMSGTALGYYGYALVAGSGQSTADWTFLRCESFGFDHGLYVGTNVNETKVISGTFLQSYEEPVYLQGVSSAKDVHVENGWMNNTTSAQRAGLACSGRCSIDSVVGANQQGNQNAAVRVYSGSQSVSRIQGGYLWQLGTAGYQYAYVGGTNDDEVDIIGIPTVTGVPSYSVYTGSPNTFVISNGGLYKVGNINASGAVTGTNTGPTSGTTINHPVCYANTAGKMQDCGVSLPPGGVAGYNDQTGLTGNALATTVFTLGSSPPTTLYQVCISEVETAGATTSSTLPNPQVKWIDADTGTVITQNILVAGYSATTNAIGTVLSGCTQIHAAASSAIQVLSGGYAASPTAGMTYAFHATAVPLR